MEPNAKTKLVTALRSNEYKQAQGVLYRPHDGYCCLGVLCEVMGATFVVSANDGRWPLIDGKRVDRANGDEYLSRDFLESVGLTVAQQDTLAMMNDNGKPFPEIADYIEQNL